MDPDMYKTRVGEAFPKYTAPPAFDTEMENADKVKRTKATLIHEAKKADWETFSAATNAVRTLILKLVEKTWVVELEDEVSGFAETTPAAIFAHLMDTSSGRHAVDSLALLNSLQGFHLNCNSVADYVQGLLDGQKSSARIDPSNKITNHNLLLFATNAMIGNDRFLSTNEKWEDLPKAQQTWTRWKKMYIEADKRANIRGPSGDNEGSAFGALQRPNLGIFPSASAPTNTYGGPMPTLDDLTTGFDNLANAATTDKAVLETLVETNKQLTSTNATLTATNERLTKEIAQLKRQNGRQRGGSEKKLCPHCKKVVAHKADDCFELEANAAKRPNGWRSSKASG